MTEINIYQHYIKQVDNLTVGSNLFCIKNESHPQEAYRGFRSGGYFTTRNLGGGIFSATLPLSHSTRK